MRIGMSSVFFLGFLSASLCAAGATGTARIQQGDGSVKVYNNVRIVVQHKTMSITSSDGKGTIVISKAACTQINDMYRCLPYAVTLDQNGQSIPISLQSGTVWLNPTTAPPQLPQSATQVQPHGVVLSLQTKRGTYVSLTGTADVLSK